MAHFLITGFIGMIAGTFLGLQVVNGDSLATVIEIASASFAGAYTAAPLGIFTGVTGGVLGGIVGVIFVYLPLSWIFTGTQFVPIVASMVVAGLLSALLSLKVPH